VVKAAGEPRQLDLVAGEVELLRDLRRERGDALRMAARVRVPRVDRAGERRGGAEARDAVDTARDAAELGQLRDVGPGEPHLVLAVLLRPVQGAVGEPDQRVALAAVLRERRDTGADRDRAALPELGLLDALHDRARGRERDLVVHAG